MVNLTTNFKNYLHFVTLQNPSTMTSRITLDLEAILLTNRFHDLAGLKGPTRTPAHVLSDYQVGSMYCSLVAEYIGTMIQTEFGATQWGSSPSVLDQTIKQEWYFKTSEGLPLTITSCAYLSPDGNSLHRGEVWVDAPEFCTGITRRLNSFQTYVEGRSHQPFVPMIGSFASE